MNNLIRITDIPTEDDAQWAQVDALLHASFPPAEVLPPGEVQRRARQKRVPGWPTRCCYQAAYLEDRLVGFTIYEFIPTTSYTYICFLVVRPAQRRQGIGAALMRHIAAWSTEQGALGVICEADEPEVDDLQERSSNLKRIAFYEAQGMHMLPLRFRSPPFYNSPLHTETDYRIMALPLNGMRSFQPADIEIIMRTILCEATTAYQRAHDTPYLAQAMATLCT